jgi:hypothetical protein
MLMRAPGSAFVAELDPLPISLSVILDNELVPEDLLGRVAGVCEHLGSQYV